MAQPLPVPFYKQQAVGYCMPACAQMVLAYQDISYSQDELAKVLNLKPGLGTPTRNIQRLASPEIKAVYEEGTLEQVQTWLGMGMLLFKPVSYRIGEMNSFNMPSLSLD